MSGWRLGALAMVVALAAVGDAAAQEAPSTLRNDAHALVRRGIPVAFVLDAETTIDTPAAAPATVPAPGDRHDAIIYLAARWAGRFDVSDDGTVVTLEARQSACTAAVERPVDTTDIRGTPVAITFALAQRLDPALAGLPPPGLLGGGPGNADDSRYLLTAVIALAGGTTSLRAALNQVVTDTGRLGWLIAEERDTDGRPACRVTLIGSHAIVQTFWAFPSP